MQHHTIDHTLNLYSDYFTFYVTYTYNSDTVTGAEFRSSSRKCFLKFCKFHRKHLCWSLFFYKVASLQARNVIKKETPAQVLSGEILSILKNTYFEEHLWTTAAVYWLLHHILSFTIHYSTRFPFLQITSSLLHN